MSRPPRFPFQLSLAMSAVLASLTVLCLVTATPVAAQTAQPTPVARLAANPAAAASVAAASTIRSLPLAASPPQVKASRAQAVNPTGIPDAAATQPAPSKKSATAPFRSASATAPVRRVALDIGHLPGGGSRSSSGSAEHNFNLRFAAALESQLYHQGIVVWRLPTSLSLADRARHAQGAALVLSVHHDASPSPAAARAAPAVGTGPAARKLSASAAGSGFQLRVGQAEPLACARALAKQLQLAGRHFSTTGFGAWADKTLGVRAGGEGALLQQAEVPVLQVSLADIANPAEERLASDAGWLNRQAAAVARGVGQCLQRPASGIAPAVPPAAAASAPRSA